jgi:YggT family protein
MQSPINNATVFLVSTLFDLYLFVLIMRLVLVAMRVDYFNPLSQMIIKLTQKIIGPLRRIIPNYKHIELATVIVILTLEIIKFVLLGLILFGLPNLIGLLLLAVADSLKSLVNFFFYAIIIQAIMSWVSTGHSPMTKVINKITAPVIKPFQRLIPPVGGMDISPIPAMIVLQLLIILFISPLFAMGWGMAFG